MLLFVLTTTACGGGAPDPDGREVAWVYGPTTGGATAEHVLGTGTRDGNRIAKGWQLRLQEGGRLVVRPYRLADSHPLFGKVVLSIGLFDTAGQQIGTVQTGPIEAKTASFTFDLAAALAARLHDVVIWYRTP